MPEAVGQLGGVGALGERGLGLYLVFRMSDVVSRVSYVVCGMLDVVLRWAGDWPATGASTSLIGFVFSRQAGVVYFHKPLRSRKLH